MKMEAGRIKMVDYERGFGFIEPDDKRDGKDVHFTRRVLQRPARLEDLQPSRRVQFERTRSPQGWTATEVTLAKEGVTETQRSKQESGGYPPGYRFLNPYNFVRYLPEGQVTDDPAVRLLDRCEPPPHDRWLGLSGTIHCRLTTVTPLFISDSEDVKPDNNVATHKRYRFFRWQGKKAIPASSLRGPVRAVFEAITNSCFSNLADRRLSYRLTGREIRTLVPARIEPDGEDREGNKKFKLRLLTGAALLRYDKPPDALYASGVRRYRALRPSGRFTGNPPPPADTNEVKHGEPCWAVLMEAKFPPSWRALALRHTNGEAVDVRRSIEGERGLTGLIVQQGWYCHTNQNADNKHSERFFFQSPNAGQGAETIEIPPDVQKKYEALIADYQDRHSSDVKLRERPGEVETLERNGKINHELAYSRHILNKHERKVRGGELVYAKLHGRPPNLAVKFLAPVSWPRVAYEHSIGDLLPKGLKRCSGSALCPACRTFGWVHGDEQGAYRGRVRFGNGILGSPGAQVGELCLAVLSSPKPTTARFYLTARSGEPTNGRPDEEVGYDGSDGENRLRGRKVYRRFPFDVDAMTISGRSDQNRTIVDAEGPGAVFQFSVEFDNLAEPELGALLWALTLDGRGQLRLGYGKPLGLGSAKIEVIGVETLSPQERFTSLSATGFGSVPLERASQWVAEFQRAAELRWGEPFLDLAPIADLLALVGDREPSLPVHYPKSPDPNSKGQFEWFVGNKREGSRGPKEELGLAASDEGLPLISKDGTVWWRSIESSGWLCVTNCKSLVGSIQAPCMTLALSWIGWMA
ncbi:MAG: TIGR03986 family CRISPR-associated RAMP protein [Blastocatellia bacterium]